MVKRKAGVEDIRKLVESVVSEAEAETVAKAVEELARITQKEPKDVLSEAVKLGVVSYTWSRLSAADIMACVQFLAIIDEKFYRRIYVKSPIDAVIEQADKFSEATKKILEGYGGGVRSIVKEVLEEERKARSGEQGGGEQKEQGSKPSGGLIDKTIDIIMSYVAEELGARVSKELASEVAPGIKEALLRMIREGKIRIELAGEEVLGEKE
jgi:hypothetical protein